MKEKIEIYNVQFKFYTSLTEDKLKVDFSEQFFQQLSMIKRKVPGQRLHQLASEIFENRKKQLTCLEEVLQLTSTQLKGGE